LKGFFKRGKGFELWNRFVIEGREKREERHGDGD
jgi:hypothetical protein